MLGGHVGGIEIGRDRAVAIIARRVLIGTIAMCSHAEARSI